MVLAGLLWGWLPGVLEAPILLTDTNELSSTAKTTIETLKPKNIYIIGGTSVMSVSIIDKVKNALWNWCKVDFNSNEGNSFTYNGSEQTPTVTAKDAATGTVLT